MQYLDLAEPYAATCRARHCLDAWEGIGKTVVEAPWAASVRGRPLNWVVTSANQRFSCDRFRQAVMRRQQTLSDAGRACSINDGCRPVAQRFPRHRTRRETSK